MRRVLTFVLASDNIQKVTNKKGARMSSYLVQLCGRYINGWSEGKAIVEDDDNKARENGRRYFNEQKRLKQGVSRFRVLKVIHEGNR